VHIRAVIVTRPDRSATHDFRALWVIGMTPEIGFLLNRCVEFRHLNLRRHARRQSHVASSTLVGYTGSKRSSLRTASNGPAARKPRHRNPIRYAP
jgi:hypothetical protein